MPTSISLASGSRGIKSAILLSKAFNKWVLSPIYLSPQILKSHCLYHYKQSELWAVKVQVLDSLALTETMLKEI
jgi:hypothetical protein